MLKNIQKILKNKKYSKPIIIFLIISSLILIYRHNNKNDAQEEMSSAIPIQTAVTSLGNFPVYISALGTVTSEKVSTVKSQITGELIKLHFKDGQIVKKGDLLAEIDSRSYKAQLSQYEGQLLRDQAILENSKLDLKRYKNLWKQNSISKQTLDSQLNIVKQNEGTVQIDQGLVDNAKVNLSYCNIRAAFDGQIGIAGIREGNIVQVNDSKSIATLTSIDPIFILFSIPETQLSEVITEHKKGSLMVEAYNQNEKKLIANGILLAIDNQVNTSTGTLTLEASFKNSDHALFPNQFTNIKLLVKTLEDVIIVPTTAIQYGSKGTFVYLLNNDQTKVQVQPVVVHSSESTYSVIKSGLTDGQTVATSGVDKLTDGTLIEPHNSNN